MDNEQLTNGSVETENMLPQSKVNELIGGAKAAAADRATREAEAKYQSKITDLEAKLSAVPAVDEDALLSKLEERRIAKEQQAGEAMEAAAIAQQFKEVTEKYDAKLFASKDIAPDFDELMKKFPHKTHQALVIGTSELPNTAEVMLYLARHPSKAFTLNQMGGSNWDGFMSELTDISKTLESQRSSGSNKVKPPLSKLKSDVVGLNNNGKRGLQELKKDEGFMSWRR